MSAASTSDSKANELVREADKKLKSWFNSDKYQEAIDLLNKAAAQYKIAKNWKEAGDTYARIAEIYNKNFKDESHEVSTHYVNAAKAYKNCSPSDATRCMAIAVNLHMEANRFSTAAKLWKDMGELYEKDMQTQDALQAYNKAADCYESEDSVANASAARLKVAQLAAELKDYQQAIEIYERVAKQCLESDKGTWSVTGYLFKAALCQFALASQTGDMSSIESTLEKYRDMHPAFESSREGKLISDLSNDFAEGDVEAYTEHVFKHDEIVKLDNWTAKLLLDIKKNIGGNGDIPNYTGDPEPDFTGASKSGPAKGKSVGVSKSNTKSKPREDDDFT